MPQCSHCAHELTGHEARCPRCGQAVAPAAGGDGSWMARLEAARRIASGHPSADGASPGIPAAAAEAPAAPPGMPAHLLVAKLEREESTRAQREAEQKAASLAAAPVPALADLSLDVPENKPPRRLPEWVWGAMVLVLVAGGLVYAYARAQGEPAPVAEVDPQTLKAAARTKEALTALQNGHQAVLDESYDEAITQYRRALKLQPTLASAERGLGIAYAAKGWRRSAIKHYRRFLELEPDGLEAAKVRALITDYERRRRSR